MSRGLGRAQREAMLALWDHPEGVSDGVPLAELKRAISSDRSNARRAIRGLVERGLAVETTGEDGERRVALTGGGHIALFLADYGDRALTLERVPGRPVHLDGYFEDPGLGLEDPMPGPIPHANEPPPEDGAVSDPPVVPCKTR